MTEVDALNNIAKAIEHVAVAIGGVGTVMWLFLFFKDMGGKDMSSSINNLATVISKVLNLYKGK